MSRSDSEREAVRIENENAVESTEYWKEQFEKAQRERNQVKSRMLEVIKHNEEELKKLSGKLELQKKTAAAREAIQRTGVQDIDYALFKLGGLDRFELKKGGLDGFQEALEDMIVDHPVLLAKSGNGGGFTAAPSGGSGSVPQKENGELDRDKISLRARRDLTEKIRNILNR